MTDTLSSDQRSFTPAQGPKRNTPNVAGGWIVMIFAFLLAMVFYFWITQQNGQQFSVAVATTNLDAGSTVTASSFRTVNVSVPNDQLSQMIRAEDIEDFNGWVTTAPLSSGDLVLQSSLREASADNGLRAMSIPVDRARAVGGALNVGDRIDVVDTTQSFANGFAARNLTVLAVNDGSGGALSGGSSFSITVAVTPADVTNIAQVLGGTNFSVIRSTGATPIAASETTTTTTAAP